MEEHVAATLMRFAEHTGFRSYKELSNANTIARKYLALHMRMVHPSIVYPYVGNDYQLVALRTHSPSIEAYHEELGVDIPTFVYLMKNGYENRPLNEDEMKRFPALQHFKENMMPRQVGEEAWVDYERDDHWKARAYFIGLNWKNTPEFYALTQAVYGNVDEQKDKDAFSDFYALLCEYEPYVDLQAKEIGTILNGLSVDKLSLIEQDLAGKNAMEEDAEQLEDEMTHGDLPSKDPIVFVAESSNEKKDDWVIIQQDEMLQDYRKRAGLNVTFSPEKTVKQMILSSLNLQVKNVPGAERIIPTSRPINEPLPPVPKEAWPMLVNAIESMNVSRHQLNPDSPMLKSMLPGGEANALSTIQTVLTLYHPECELESLDPRVKTKLLKEHPVIDASVVQSILEM